MKEHQKLCQKMVSEIVCIFVCGHLDLWKDVMDFDIQHEIYTILNISIPGGPNCPNLDGCKMCL